MSSTFFRTQKTILSLSITILSILGYGFFVFAAQLPDGTPPPTGGYSAGDNSILDPGCAPGSANCIVNPYYVTTASTYNWMGTGAGGSGGSTNNTVFIGVDAGVGASAASYSNFIGTDAGQNAINASNSNFLGQLAGCGATNANDANFFGFRAGCGAINANNANFFGNSSGEDAVNAAYSTYFGDHTGYQATDAAYANFIGANAGRGAYNAFNSNFLGYNAGRNAFNAHDSNFFGYQAGEGADTASFSTFAGNNAGFHAYGASNSVLMGFEAGYNTTNVADFLTDAAGLVPFGIDGNVVFMGYRAGKDAVGSTFATFIGSEAGLNAVQGQTSTFIGTSAGSNTSQALASVFVGYYAGASSSNTATSIFIGNQSGANLVNSPGSKGSIFVGNGTGQDGIGIEETVLIGKGSGQQSSNILQSVFLGNTAGEQSSAIESSLFLGNSAGGSAQNTAYSIFIGTDAGSYTNHANGVIAIGNGAVGYGNDPVSNNQVTLTYNNLANGPFQEGEIVQGSLSNETLGLYSDDGANMVFTSATGGYQIGETITGLTSGATATVIAATQGETSIVIGDTAGTGGFSNSIALGARTRNTAEHQFMIGSSQFPIDETMINGTGGTNCSITTGIGLACSSDERLKTNITDLGSTTLDTLLNVRTVSYNWKTNPTSNHMIGFLAQDLERYFPELVATDAKGMKSVYYSQITPILVEAIRELNIKLENLGGGSVSNRSLFAQLITWFGDTGNGIQNFFARKIITTEFCVEDICVTKEQFKKMVETSGISVQVPQNEQQQNQTPEPESTIPTDETTPDQPVVDTTSDTTSVAPTTPPAEPENTPVSPETNEPVTP